MRLAKEMHEKARATSKAKANEKESSQRPTVNLINAVKKGTRQNTARMENQRENAKTIENAINADTRGTLQSNAKDMFGTSHT